LRIFFTSIPDREAQSLDSAHAGPQWGRGLHQGGTAAGTEPGYGPAEAREPAWLLLPPSLPPRH